jgi:hypothetical protein
MMYVHLHDAVIASIEAALGMEETEESELDAVLVEFRKRKYFEPGAQVYVSLISVNIGYLQYVIENEPLITDKYEIRGGKVLRRVS